jgi:hypothetical protein
VYTVGDVQVRNVRGERAWAAVWVCGVVLAVVGLGLQSVEVARLLHRAASCLASPWNAPLDRD